MQVNSTVSFTGKKPPKKPKTKNKGLVTAGYASSLVTSGTALAALGLSAGERKLTQLDSNDVVAIKKGIQEGLKDSGLYDKGVRVYRFQENAPTTFAKRMAFEIQKLSESENVIGSDEIKKTINNIFGYGKKDAKALNTMRNTINEGLSEAKVYADKALNGVPEEAQGIVASTKRLITDFGAKALGLKYKLGLGVDYLPGMNTIFAPNKSLQTKIFHEIGHALSADSAFVKTLQKAKPMAMIIPGIVLTAALCNKRKTTDEKLPTDSKFQRLKTVSKEMQEN